MPSQWTDPNTVNPNAPLSTLLPQAGSIPGTTNYAGTLQPGVSSSSKQQYLTDILGTSGTQALTSGGNIMQSGINLLGKPLDYWQNLLKTPTRQSILERTGPAVSSVVSQYDVGKRQVSQQPRGGGTSATLANLPFQESGAVTGLLENELKQVQDVLQPEAAKGITGIAEDVTGFGQYLQTLGLSEASLAESGLSDLVWQSFQRQRQNFAIWQDIGKAIGGLIAPLLLGGGSSGGGG